MTRSLRPLKPGVSPDALHERLASLTGKRVAVIGLGKSGVAAAELLARMGAGTVDVLDDKADAELEGTRKKLAAAGNIVVTGGGIHAEKAASAHLVVVSPGVPLKGAWWTALQGSDTPWMGEAELAWRTTHAPWLCVTGTNGKSTTTTMLGGLVKKAGGHTFVGGNLGDPVCGAAYTASAWDHFVIELSSYQCEGISSLDATSAVLTNLTPDHLDRYDSVGAYFSAKMRLFEAQSMFHAAVINAGDKESVERASLLKNVRLDFGVAHGAQGVEIEGRTLVLRRGRDVERYTVENPQVRGRHNLENAAASVAAARAAGIPMAAVQAGLDAFESVPHRLQEVGRIGGVLYVNDSKGTNVDATIKALESFSEPIHLIAGGKDKHAPYEPMVQAAKGRVKTCYVIGEAAPLLHRAMEGTCSVVDCGTMETALERAKTAAKPGEVVLLSPACASFDQFKNYEHRGDVFAAWVRAHSKETP